MWLKNGRSSLLNLDQATRISIRRRERLSNQLEIRYANHGCLIDIPADVSTDQVLPALESYLRGEVGVRLSETDFRPAKVVDLSDIFEEAKRRGK